MTRCSECGGSGEVMDMEVRQFGRYQMQWTVCTTCDGTGRAEAPIEKRAQPLDGPLTGLARAGWASRSPAANDEGA